LGIVVPNVSYVFLEMYAQATACLSNIQVACVACQLINTPFIVGWGVVVFRRFVLVGYGISAFECHLDICVPEHYQFQINGVRIFDA